MSLSACSVTSSYSLGGWLKALKYHVNDSSNSKEFSLLLQKHILIIEEGIKNNIYNEKGPNDQFYDDDFGKWGKEWDEFLG
jgi:hypothetical protein